MPYIAVRIWQQWGRQRVNTRSCMCYTLQVHLIDFGDDHADSGSQDVGHVDAAELSESSSPESLTSRRTASPPGRPAPLVDSRASSMGLPPAPTSSEEVLLDLDDLVRPSTPPPRSETAPQMMARSASASTTTLRDSRPGKSLPQHLSVTYQKKNKKPSCC